MGYHGAMQPAVVGTAGAGLGPAATVILDESLPIGTAQLGPSRRSHCSAIGGDAPLTASGAHSGGRADGRAD
eukprot:5438487-Alexandrium_andersonii.AAC.1